MSYKKGKPETTKEVRKMSELTKQKQRERKQLVNFLNCKWQHANATAYSKQFRSYKLIEMINEITFYLYDEYGLISLDEQYKLLSLIRAISDVIDGKAPANKRLLEMRLKYFTELSGA